MDSNCNLTQKPGLKPGSKKGFFKSWYFWKPFLGVIIGGLGGFLYYHFIGCNSGSCAITSNPYGSIIAGGWLGLVLMVSRCKRYNL